jgi:hypothetical protein
MAEAREFINIDPVQFYALVEVLLRESYLIPSVFPATFKQQVKRDTMQRLWEPIMFKIRNFQGYSRFRNHVLFSSPLLLAFLLQHAVAMQHVQPQQIQWCQAYLKYNTTVQETLCYNYFFHFGSNSKKVISELWGKIMSRYGRYVFIGIPNHGYF